MALEVYEVSQVIIGSGQSITFTDGFYKITDVKGVLTSTVGALPVLALKLNGVDVVANPNWINISAGTPITAGDLAGEIVLPTTWASQPIVQVGDVLSAPATSVGISLTVTVAKVGFGVA